MLLRLSANDHRFRGIDFRPGLNLLVADTTGDSTDKDSRNGTGKSSMVELLHFLLGARADKKSLATRPEVRGIRFVLELEWPDGELTISRRGDRPDTVTVDRNIAPAHEGTLFDAPPGPVDLPVAQWSQLIESALFRLPKEHSGLSGRTLLSFLMRRVGSHAFNTANRTYPQQPAPDASANLAYLLGLDWKLAAGYRDIAARETTRRQLRKAVDDPVWGKIVGSVAELRGQLALAEEEVRRIGEEVASFRVVPQYEELKRRADDIAVRIRSFNSQDTIDQRNLSDLKAAVEQATDGEVRYLESVYRELGIVLGNQVRRRFDDVRGFHASIVRNRRRYLSEEIQAVEQRLADRAAERARLGQELQQVLRTLNDGGALEVLTALQQALAEKRASLEALRHRYEAAQTLEASALEITERRTQLKRAVAQDLDERHVQTQEATVLFSRFAQHLYGRSKRAYLEIDAGPSSLKIEPRIDDDGSRGISNMVIFCFDLTLAVIAHRHGRGPDFLVHDSHLFDGVDERQIAAALELVDEVTVDEGMQYLATFNSDVLNTAQRGRGFDAFGAILEPRLTDANDAGKLFGFRF
jgi:uncharacterized protein YydD (DUF2326 family)